MRAIGVASAALGTAAGLFGIGLFVKTATGGYESPWYALVFVGLLFVALGAAFGFVGVRLIRTR